MSQYFISDTSKRPLWKEAIVNLSHLFNLPSRDKKSDAHESIDSYASPDKYF